MRRDQTVNQGKLVYRVGNKGRRCSREADSASRILGSMSMMPNRFGYLRLLARRDLGLRCLALLPLSHDEAVGDVVLIDVADVGYRFASDSL